MADSKVNSQINALNDIETSNFIKNENKAFFVSIEGYHPISSFLLFKIEKIYHGLEHSIHVKIILDNILLKFPKIEKSIIIYEFEF